MSQVIQLLNTGARTRLEHKRVWANVGQPITIGRHLSLTFLSQVEDGERTLVYVVTGPGVRYESPLPAASWVNLRGLAGLIATPRAVQLSPSGRFQRVFLEFVSLKKDVRFH